MSILADCLFYLCSGLVLMFVAHFMKEWEERHLRRIYAIRANKEYIEEYGQTINCRCAYVPMMEYGNATQRT